MSSSNISHNSLSIDVKISIDTNKKLNNEILQLELKEISKNPICVLNHNYSTYNRLPSQGKKTILNNCFYNILNIFDLNNHSDSIFYADSTNNGITKNYKIRDWLQNDFEKSCSDDIICIKNESRLSLGPLQSNILFENTMIKSNYNNSNLQHELFIALFGTNSLKNTIPNFSYILGGFKSKQIIDENEFKKLSLGDDLQEISDEYDFNTISYNLYEKILPGVTFSEYCKTCDFTDFLNKYIQILLALEIASKEIDFTHYNLTSNNVIIYDKFSTGGLRAIKYRNEYLFTDKVAMIINYDTAHIKYRLPLGPPQGRNVDYGIISENAYNVCRPIHDAYKLLATSMKYMSDKCLFDADKIVKFFAKDGIYYKHDNNDYISLDIKYDRNINDLIKFIRTTFDCNFILSNPVTFPIAGTYSNAVGIDKNIAVFISGLDLKNVEKMDMFNFYDCLLQLGKLGKNEEVRKLVKAFNRERELPRIIKLIKYNYNLIQSQNIIIPINDGYSFIFNIDFLELYKCYVYNVLRILEGFYQIQYLQNLLENVNKIYNIKEKIDYGFNLDYTLLTTYSNDILKFIKFVNTPNKENKEYGIKKINENPEFNWYYTDLVSLGTIIRAQVQ
jgi:hypothetical protein